MEISFDAQAIEATTPFGFLGFGRQPRWGWGANHAAVPRIAEYGNPGLADATPFGVDGHPSLTDLVDGPQSLTDSG